MSTASPPPRWLLRRSDQIGVAAIVVLVSAAIGGWWVAHGGWGNGLIEIDQAQPLSARCEVDVNAAEIPELMQLPGVGPVLAQRILDSRKSIGPFASDDDLRRVHGIGAKRLEQIRPYLRPMPGNRAETAYPAPEPARKN